MRWIDRLRPETAFAIVAGAVGLAMAFVTPPTLSPDEPNHWCRAYGVSLGHVIGMRQLGPDRFDYAGEVPASLMACAGQFADVPKYRWGRVPVRRVLAEFGRPLRPERTERVALLSSAVYSPLAYGPAAVGVTVGRLLSLPPVAGLYLGRLGTLAAYVGLGRWAVRLLPVGRWPVAMLLAGPMAVFLAASISPDPVTTGVAAVATAWALRCRVDAGVPPARAAVGLCAALLAVALCKPVAYLPLVGLVLIVPGDRWGGGPWRRRLTPATIAAVVIAVAVAWSAITHPQHLRERGDDPADQLAWVRAHPVAFAGVCGRTVATHGLDYLTQAVGMLGWLDAPLPPWLPPAFGAGVLWLALWCGEPVRLGAWPRAVVVGVIVASLGLIAVANYAVWNKVGAAEIEGLQGRYLLPLAAAGLAVIHRRTNRPVRPRWVVVGLTAAGLCAVLTLVRRYYLPDDYTITW